jgi:hypothetical protein
LVAIRYATCHQPHLYAKKKLSKMEKSNTKKTAIAPVDPAT